MESAAFHPSHRARASSAGRTPANKQGFGVRYKIPGLYRQLPRIDPLQVGLVEAAPATTSDEVMLAALTPELLTC